MAVTHGHGNPKWTKDETILALNVLFQLEGKNPSPNNQKIINLSRTLNQLPIHPISERNEQFRNPVGVSMKIQNLLSEKTGKGMTNNSKMDKEVWKEYGNKPKLVAQIANEIICNCSLFYESDHLEDEIPDEESFTEGKIITATHKRKERDHNLRKTIIAKRIKENKVYCDICGIKPYFDASIDSFSIFECHHIFPLAQSGGVVTTKIEDIAFLCANCHKAIHNKIAKEKRWITPDEMKKSIQKQ